MKSNKKHFLINQIINATDHLPSFQTLTSLIGGLTTETRHRFPNQLWNRMFYICYARGTTKSKAIRPPYEALTQNRQNRSGIGDNYGSVRGESSKANNKCWAWVFALELGKPSDQHPGETPFLQTCDSLKCGEEASAEISENLGDLYFCKVRHAMIVLKYQEVISTCSINGVKPQASGLTSTVSTQCRLLQTPMSPSRLAVIGDCQTNNGDYVVTYIYVWHCMNYAEDDWELEIGASNSVYDLPNYCTQCGIVGTSGFACRCITNGWDVYHWTKHPFNIDDIFALDGIGNMKCR